MSNFLTDPNFIIPRDFKGELEAERHYELVNQAEKVFKTLLQYIRTFEMNLDEEHEVGVNLVSFGKDYTFHVHRVSYKNPSLISFEGVTPKKERVQLIQHVSQLNFLLIGIQKMDEKPTRIGFVMGQTEKK